MREYAAWSDKAKTPVTAQDFVFGLQRALDKYTNSPKAYTLYCIKNARKINIEGAPADSLGVSAPDLHTVGIELEYPMENFLYLLATAPTMPCNKDFFEGANGQYGLEPATIISNGAFKVKLRYGWNHYNSLSLVKNENYIGANVPEDILKSRVASMSHQVALVPISVESPFALDFLNTFKSENSKNIASLNSPEYDKLINIAVSANAKDACKPIVAAEKYLVENAVFYPMYMQSRFFAWSNKVKGLIFHNYGQGVDFFFATKRK